jgi:hypothetical protein
MVYLVATSTKIDNGAGSREGHVAHRGSTSMSRGRGGAGITKQRLVTAAESGAGGGSLSKSAYSDSSTGSPKGSGEGGRGVIGTMPVWRTNYLKAY